MTGLLLILYLLKRVLQLYNHSSDVALERRRGHLGARHHVSTELTRPAAPVWRAEVWGGWHRSQDSQDMAGPPDWHGSKSSYTALFSLKTVTTQ